MNIKSFVFSPFQENTYVLFDESKQCVIIDPGCYEKWEKEELKAFIEAEGLTPVMLLNTHCHIDHVFGNYFVHSTWGLKPIIHKEDLFLLERVEQIAGLYQIPNVDISPDPLRFIEEGEVIEFGNTKLDIIFVPGHAPGHVAFINHESKNVLAGDVLFKGSIGRTDLPGGDFDTLIKSIKTKMFTLPDEYIVHSGHGPTTTIGEEKRSNPFLQ